MIARWRGSPWWRKFVFAVSGTAGFVVDAAVMLLLSDGLHVEAHVARVFSFLISMTVTWQINRHFTFREGRPDISLWLEWRRYLASSLLGGLTNYAAFSLALAASPFFREHLVLAVAIGSLAGMVTNYLLYSRYVFRKPA